MGQTHQTKIQARIRIQQIAGRVVLLIGAGLLIYGLTGTGVIPVLFVTKPDFSCANAPPTEAPILDQAAKEQLSLQLDGASRELWRDQRRRTIKSDAAATAAVRRSLAARKDALVRTMRVNSEAAVAALLTKTERTALSKLAANCVESEVTQQGTLEITHLDDFSGDESNFQYTLTTANGAQLQLHIAHADSRDLPSGAKVKVRGYQIGNDVLLDAAAAPAGSTIDAGSIVVTAAPAPATLTNYRAAVIMVYYSDETQPASPTVAGVNDLLNTTMNGYYQENSYGKVGFTGDVYGWYQVPIAAADCSYGPMGTAAITAADADIDFTQYTHLITIFRAVSPNCPYGGLAGLNKAPVKSAEGTTMMYTSFVSSVSAYVMGHELGHNFRIHHAQYYPCDPPYTDYYFSYYSPTCRTEEYGDIYDIMGSSYTGHFTAQHKEITSFFDPGMIEVVPPGTHDYVLEPLETASRGLKAVKVLRGIKTVGGMDDYLYVEYRRPIGYDASISAYGRDVYDGAVLHVFGASNLHSGLFDPTPSYRSRSTATLPVGSSYTDPMSGVIIQTTGQTDDALAVTVTTGREDLTPPSVYVSEPSWGQTVSGTISVNVTATDSTGIDRVEFRLGSKVGLPFATIMNAPYTVTLDTTRLPNGTNYLIVTAYDRAGKPQGLEGNWFSASQAITVANEDAVPPTVTLTTPASGASVTSGALSTAADANDNVSIWKVEFYVDGGVTPAVIDMTAPYTGSTNIFTLGPHTITAAAYDMAGNRVDSPAVSFTIVADTVNPTAAMLMPLSGAVASGNVNVTFTKSDDSDNFSNSYLMVDGTVKMSVGSSANEFWWDSRGVPDGAHQLAIQVGDRAGHLFQTAGVTVTVDNSAPMVILTSPGSGILPMVATLTADATHARGIARVDFYRDGVRLIGSDSTAPYELTWDTQTIVPGAHTISARAVSTTGTNTTSAQVSVTTTDLTAPTVMLTSPLNGATIAGTITLAATANDAPAPSTPRVEFYLDGSVLLGSDTTAPYSWSWDGYSVFAGLHTLTAMAIDSVGNITSSSPTNVTTIAPDGGAPAAVTDLIAF